jgi:glutathione S-transferase
LDYKKIPYSFVKIPMVANRPLRNPLDGGYRRTPILQIGSDIYCDTHCIIQEIERRWPTPTLFPKTQSGADITGIAWGMTAWTDALMFKTVAAQLPMSTFPQAFVQDRANLNGVKNFDAKKADALSPYEAERLRSQLVWLETQLQGGKWVLDTQELSLADFNVAMPLWFIQSLRKDKLLENFPAVKSWMGRFFSAFSKSKPTKMTAEEALEIAKNTPSTTQEAVDINEPNGLKPGDLVSVMPVDTGRIPVVGKDVSSSANHVALRRKCAETGIETVIHFPRSGFLVIPVKDKL